MKSLLILALCAAPALASDAGGLQMIEEYGASQPEGKCSPQFIIRLPDQPPNAEHISASGVQINFAGARICSPTGPDEAESELLKQQVTWPYQ